MGVQVAALRDPTASFGTIGIFATAEVPMAVAFSALVVRAIEGEPDHPQPMAGTFDVVLRRLGNAKIMAIKAVREATGIGLKEAKDLVETANARLLVGGSQSNAERLVDDLRRIGCDVEMRRSR